jgi:hypothetical protein
MHLGNWLSRVVVDAVASREGSRPPAGEARRPLSSQGIPNGVPGRSCPFVAPGTEMDPVLSVVSNAPPLVSYLIGMLAIMAGSVLFVGAFLLKPTKTEVSTDIPSMRDQARTIPPNYEARESHNRFGRDSIPQGSH